MTVNCKSSTFKISRIQLLLTLPLQSISYKIPLLFFWIIARALNSSYILSLNKARVNLSKYELYHVPLLLKISYGFPCSE